MKALGQWVYDTSDRLGGGGFSDVYRCHRPEEPGIHLAIKVLKNPAHQKTLQREVQALNAMQGCPGVPRLMDHGRDHAGNLCLVTELMAGIRLDRLVHQQGRLGEQAVQAMAQQILSVLQVAHGIGLLHKDITPGNILWNGEHASLIDWGVSEPLGEGRAPHIRSKREYCAPEYFHHLHGMASDFYSLAWVMVFALTGSQPYHFDGEKDPNYRVVAHCLERPEFALNIPPEWGPLLWNWTSKDPGLRAVAYQLDDLVALGPHLKNDWVTSHDFRRLQHAVGWRRLAERYEATVEK